MTLASGAHLAHYQITSLLGRGGMGEVYRAHDSRLKRDVAIKVLPETFARNPARLARFRREAQVLAQLNHPNIASIYELGESGGVIFLVMEYVAGETLAEALRAGVRDRGLGVRDQGAGAGDLESGAADAARWRRGDPGRYPQVCRLKRPSRSPVRSPTLWKQRMKGRSSIAT